MKSLPPAALLLAALAGGCGTAGSTGPAELAEPGPVSLRGPYEHPSGLEFPERVAGIERGRLTRYDRESLDVSAGYTCRDDHHPLAATIYVYPGPTVEQIGSPKEAVAAAMAHFQAVKEEVLKKHDGVRVVSEEQFPMMVKGTEYPALRATLEFEDEWAGTRMPLRSHIYLVPFYGGRWIVKYRFTHPKDGASEAEVQAFVKEWPGAR